MQNNLNDKVQRATKWSSITEIAAKLIAPITNAILARLLVPEAFGVVATLNLVISFAEIFTDAGFQKYIVQHQFKDDKELNLNTNVAFWTNLLVSLLFWVGISYFATPITNMMGSPGHETAIIVMSAVIPITAFSTTQMARYRRDFDFKTLFVIRMCTTMVPLLITVPLAFIMRSYWALVFGSLARSVLNALILTVKSKWRPSFSFSFVKLKEMLSFSLWSMVENISIWLSVNIGTFIVSSSLSAYYLGLYKTTTSTVSGYLSIITSATTPVLFAALSRCQDDDEQFRKTLFQFQRMVATLVFPLGFGLLVYRELATTILLGNQWMETADFLGLWAWANCIAVVFNNYNSEVLRSKGKPRLSVLVQMLHLVVLVPVLIFAVKLDYRTFTLIRSIVRLQIIWVSSIVVKRVTGIKFVDYLKNVWPSICASVVMAVAGILLRQLFDNIVWEFTTIFICVLVYAGVMLLLPSGRKQLAEIPVLKKIFRLGVRKVKK